MIKIKAVERKVGFNKTGKTLWYPAIHLHSDVKFEEFIELVADETTMSSADVKAVFDRASKVLVRLERAERFLDVPYKSSAKKKKDKPEGGESTPVPGNSDDHVGI